MTKEELLNWVREAITSCKFIPLEGNWANGIALDNHTTSSRPIKDDNEAIVSWDTERPPLGEALYKLKYKKDKKYFKAIAIVTGVCVEIMIDKGDWAVDVIVPVPPSDLTREFQPVEELAKLMGEMLKIQVDTTSLSKTKSTSQLKQIEDPTERKKILKDVFKIELNKFFGKNVLIFDDLYRSGETLNAVSETIMNKGKAKNVFVLTITKTRTKR